MAAKTPSTNPPSKQAASKKAAAKKAKPSPPSSSGPLMETSVMGEVIQVLDVAYQHHPMHDVTEGDPYKVLIGCILSLRTNDDVTIPACSRLFKEAHTPTTMLTLSAEDIQKLVYPVGFYRNKSETILQISADLLEKFQGQVPKTIEELLTLKGVGRKTANLVVGLGHQLPAICVDTHVHRICNRLGYIETSDPEETEYALRDKLPVQYWPIINRVLVLHGREVCKPIGARCDVCPVVAHCQQRDVKPRKPPKASGSKAAQS